MVIQNAIDTETLSGAALALEWLGLAAPFAVLLGCCAWLLTPAGGRAVLPGLFRRPLARRRETDVDQSTALPDPAETIVVPLPVLAVIEDVAEAEPDVPLSEPGVFNRRCKMDLAATKGGLELTVELPGVEERDVAIQVANDLLTISGHVSFEPDREERNYRLIERDYGAFSRSIELPEGVAPDQIRASLSRGLLTLTIPNPSRPAPKIIEVRAEPSALSQTADGFELRLDLPGLEEADIDVSVNSRWLAVRVGSEVDAGAPCGGLAGRHGAYSRSVELPETANIDLISAMLSKGVLTVTIPNAATPDSRRIAVRAAA